ncbi:DUF2278 family protein [Streptomyces sp. NPDC002814]
MPLKAYGVLITRAVDTRREGADDTPHYHPARMRPLPPDADGPDNYLADVLDHYVRRAVDDPEARLYVFRERWGPENGAQDKVFGFRLGNGVHDIHTNQGNSRRFRGDDEVWQDGGILIHFPGQSRWVGIFLTFQSQSWHTDDITGHALEGAETVRVPSPLVSGCGSSPRWSTPRARRLPVRPPPGGRCPNRQQRRRDQPPRRGRPEGARRVVHRAAGGT